MRTGARRLLGMLLLIAGVEASAAELSFDAALARARKITALPSASNDVLAVLETPPRYRLPSLRAEASASTAETLDIFTNRRVRSETFLAVASADYVVFDGGFASAQQRSFQLTAASFRRRIAELERETYDDIVHAYADLYVAQEQLHALRERSATADALLARSQEMLEAGTISNLTAALWQDSSLAIVLQRNDAELRWRAAHDRLKQLTGDESDEILEVRLDTPQTDAPVSVVRNLTAREKLTQEQSRASLHQAATALRPQVVASAFAGLAVPTSNDSEDDNLGVYGFRFSVSLPALNPAMRQQLAEARLREEESALLYRRAVSATRARLRLQVAELETLRQKLALQEESVAVSKRRAESLRRLAAEGLRSDRDAVEATEDVHRREDEIIVTRAAIWKLERQIDLSPSQLPAADGAAQ